MSTIPYADTAYAYEYFSDRLRAEAYTEADDQDKIKALKMATRAIDKLSFAGTKADPNQEYQFPRGSDVAVPSEIKDACCELALALLDGVDPNLEIENLSVLKNRMGDAEMQRDIRRADHIQNGIPSLEAWNLIKPFLWQQTEDVDISRTS